MKPSLQTFMSPGDTRTVPRRLYKTDVNPNSDYRQWSTLKHSAEDKCAPDTQLQLHNIEPENATCELQQELTETAAVVAENMKEEEREVLNLVQPTQKTQISVENTSCAQNVEQETLPESPRSIHSLNTNIL